jgi:hypothetical protein
MELVPPVRRLANSRWLDGCEQGCFRQGFGRRPFERAIVTLIRIRARPYAMGQSVEYVQSAPVLAAGLHSSLSAFGNASILRADMRRTSKLLSAFRTLFMIELKGGHMRS